ncbi:NUDIX domain-containing protein [Gordonia desulfuricans]|uniref:NUDIX domain-containing protein n=1 Tax=Gordonia desulfuricans TaxID=89051 RepID=A0A7K3LIJ2_9ACTN|nr:NUDIX domain-containing protein [Gordonia desulfuricans]NDK88089.1 NUDIX domain-containing protein [Gordonia desulfuricans]
MSEHPAPLRDAATVVLVRDSGNGIEVFLQRRVKQMAFAGGMTVFPGGGVDPRDADADLAWTGPDPAWWAEQFSTTTELAQALVCAAVRETFEECGVLLASSGERFPDPASLRAERTALVDKSLSFAEFLRGQGLSLRADLLRPLSHWITPVNESRRYDTRFFLAQVPPGQEPDGATSEADVARWAGAQDALDAWSAGRHFLLPPTWAQLTEVAGHATVEALMAVEHDIHPIQPDVGSGERLTSLSFERSADYFAGMADNVPEDLGL